MDKTYLVFGYGGARYALGALSVCESVWLPALAPFKELPRYIVGAFSLRGALVPVLDLALCFGERRQPHAAGDLVIVIEVGAARVGIIANELHEVEDIAWSALDDAAAEREALGARAQFVRGVAKSADGLTMLLDVAALLACAPPQDAMSLDQAQDEGARPDAAPLEQLFRGRARELARAAATKEPEGLAAYAVIGLGGELFGLDAAFVQGFAHIRNPAPVPCCPAHIIGNMNLRGDILTLLDIRPVLGMPGAGAAGEVAVLRAGDLTLGFAADELLDVVTLAPADIAAVPAAADGAARRYCKGVATVGGRAVSLLDVEELLAAAELRVEETVR